MTVDHPIHRYRQVVVWGVHEGTHVHIHRHFLQTLVALGVEAYWVENSPASAEILEPGTLVIAAWDSSHLPYRDDVDYCLHNWFFEGQPKVLPNVIYLQVFLDLKGERFENMGPTLDTHPYFDSTSSEALDYEYWGRVTLWNPKLRTLVQPWGTPEKWPFWSPVGIADQKPAVVFVGSVWDNDEGMGNVRVMAEVERWCADTGWALLSYSGVTDEEAIDLVRGSELAPAIGGEFQDRMLQLPCRGFKNVSYGQLCFTNLSGFDILFGDCGVVDKNIAALFDRVAGMLPSERRDLIVAQQDIVAVHTYDHRLAAICRALEVR